MRRFALLTSLAGASLTMGCAGDLPLEELITTIRPLALRTEVIGDDPNDGEPVRAEALPFETVRMVPFIVDPEGPLAADQVAQLEPTWIACNLQPIEGLFSCIGNQQVAPDDVVDCPPADASDLKAGTLPESPPICRITGGTAAQPEHSIPIDFNFLLGGDVEVTMVGHQPDEGSTQQCLEAVLAGDLVPQSCVLMTQRVAIGPDTELVRLAEAFGVEDLDDLAQVPEDAPDPDTNPRIESFTVTVLDEDLATVASYEVQRGQTIEAQLGWQLEIETRAPTEDLQVFLIPQDNDFAERLEDFEGRWFRTWGDLLSPESNDPTSVNTWTMIEGDQDEDDVPPGGVATMFYVLRDSRQGVDWWWFNVRLVGG